MTIREGSEKLAKALLLPINPAVVVLLGLYTLTWGLWTVAPWWDVFSHGEIYGVIATVAPEWVWGLLAIAVGIVIIYGAIRRRYKPLVLGAAVGGWHWFMIAIFYFLGEPLNTAGLTALTFAIYAGFLWVNLRVNFKETEKLDDVLNK